MYAWRHGMTLHMSMHEHAHRGVCEAHVSYQKGHATYMEANIHSCIWGGEGLLQIQYVYYRSCYFYYYPKSSLWYSIFFTF